MRGWRVVLLIATIAAAVLALVTALGSGPLIDYNNSNRTVSAPGEAIVALEQLPVKGRAAKTGYSREQFGPTWKDVDGNGCDTRNDILVRDLEPEVLGPDGCEVESGTLQDPYTGRTLAFQRGRDTSRLVQIDHVVALGDAWQKGAQGLDEGLRTALANDPTNLVAVDGPTNGQKSDSDAATWLPPNGGYRCVYVARQITVKKRYELWVTEAEKRAMADVLSTCPDQRLIP
jgi:hypothetical protein